MKVRRVTVHTPATERGARIRTKVVGVGMTLILVLSIGVGDSCGELGGVFASCGSSANPPERSSLNRKREMIVSRKVSRGG